MKRLLGVALLLLVPVPAFGQLGGFGDHIPLEVTGPGVHMVEVDVVRVFKEKRTAASKFPVEVRAPKGGGIYFWTYPAGVVAIDRGDVLEITAAPKGEITVTVKALVIDWDKKQTRYDLATITFLIGDVPPGPDPGPGPVPPIPPPPPDVPAQLLADLKVALVKDKAGDGDTILVKSLAAVLRGTAGLSNDESRFKTLADVSTHFRNDGQAKIGNALQETRAVLSAYLGAQLGKDLALALGPAGAANRQKVNAAFTTAAQTLEAASK